MECLSGISLIEVEPYLIGFFVAIALQRLWVSARHHLSNNTEDASE